MSHAPLHRAVFASLLVSIGASFLYGCGSCGGGAALREGPHPYRACLLSDAPNEREVELGEGTLVVEGRRARLEAASQRLKVAALRGSDDELDDLNRAASVIDEEGVALIFVLGGLGRTQDEAKAHLEALALTRKPIVLVPGGDDSLAAIDGALGALSRDARARIVDGRRAHVLEAGGAEWLLVPGAPNGRYAYSSEACGYEASDLEERRRALRTEAPLALAWAAPSEGSDVPRRGVFAFPGGPSSEGRVFVGPIAGPPHFSGGAYRASGPTLLEIADGEVRELGTLAFRHPTRMVRPPSP